MNNTTDIKGHHLLRIFIVFMIIPLSLFGQRSIGDILYDDSIIHSIRLTFDQSAYWDSLVLNKGISDQEISKGIPSFLNAAHVSIDGKRFYAPGVRIIGKASYDFSKGKKKSFQIKLNEFVSCHEYDGIETLNLHNHFKDPTMMREKLYLDFLREVNAPAPRAAYSKLFINGEYWGLYLLVEEVDQNFLTYHYGNSNGNLYKCHNEANLKFEGYKPSSYRKNYKNVTKGETGIYQDLSSFLATIHTADSKSGSFVQQLERTINTNDVLKAYAVNSVLLNLDSYNMEFQRNFYLYFNPKQNKFSWISHKGNFAFAGWTSSYSVQETIQRSIFQIDAEQKSDLARFMLHDNEDYKAQYAILIQELLEKHLTHNKLNSRIATIYAKIRKAVYSDDKKMYSNEEFEQNIHKGVVDNHFDGVYIPGIKDFFEKRKQFIMQEIRAL